MKYNFDEIINRENTGALKIDAMQIRWGRKDLIPLWVADMDLPTAPFVTEAIRKRAAHPIFGYPQKLSSWRTAIQAWQKLRYNWEINTKWIGFVPGVVPGIAFAIQCLTEVGDKILIMPPVYQPFHFVVQNNHRELVYAPILQEGEQFEIDWKVFEKRLKGCKLFVLCNPHNPGGRVWKKEELERIAILCLREKVRVVSDEIHADLTFSPYKHCPFATVNEEMAQQTITLMSPSKAFNMAGLCSSYCVIPNPDLYRQYMGYLNGNDFAEGHFLAFLSVEAAYSHGTEWLFQLQEYLLGNIDYICKFLATNCPNIQPIRPQACFLIWLDCRKMKFISQQQLIDFFVDKAHLALNDGQIFGKEEGEGYMRLNIGSPRPILEQAMKQLKEAYDAI